MASSMLGRLRVLSAAPWFDEPTAADLLQLAPGSDSLRDGEDPPSLRDIRLSGVLIHRGNASRVAEPLRSELRNSLYSENEELYLRAIGVFVQHAQNGFSSALTAVMGSHGSWLNVKALSVVAGDDGSAFDDLIDGVQESRVRSSSAVAEDAARLIEHYSFKTDRRTDFLNGLALWNRGERVAATMHFERVLEEKRDDRASAISGHLVGVTRYSEGELGSAIELLSESVQILRELEDLPGLAVTLTTLGRVHREVFRTHESHADLVRAIQVLEEAAELAPRVSVGRGRALTALAQCYQDDGDSDRALRLASDAVELLSAGDDAVSARTTLALISREVGDETGYEAALEDAARYAEKHHVGDVQLARLLNMLAASRRRAGDLEGARDAAQRSLQMGRRMNDQRHIAHAAHTLAAINLDSLPDDPAARGRRLREIERLLHESRSILAGFKNTYGIGMVDNTLSRYYGTVARDSTPEAAVGDSPEALAADTEEPEPQ